MTATLRIGDRERVLRFEPGERDPWPYALVPVDVPAGIRALRLSLDHDGRGAAGVPATSILDLGLLAPGPTDVGRADLRGWSGSERSVVVVGETAATPGYRPGPIEPGTWHVLLGLYLVPAEGVRARITIEVLESEPPVPGGVSSMRSSALDRGPQPAASPPAAPAPTTPAPWRALDLHAHTLHSDGAETVAGLAERARDAGLDALFVTDHNTDAHLPELPVDRIEPPALLPGEEVTTYRGHLNALGIERWIEFRYVDAVGVARAIDEIQRGGALASVNHPTSADIPWLHGSELPMDCVEVWNGPWTPEDDDALRWWESILAAGRRLTAVGGSDSHGPGPAEQPVGTPTTWVRAAALRLPVILDSIRAGRVVLTRDPAVPPPELWLEAGGRRAAVGETLRLEAEDGAPIEAHWSLPPELRGEGRPSTHPIPRVRLVVDGVVSRDAPADAGEGGWTVPPGERPTRARLEVRGAGGELLAVTNPVYVEA